MVGVLRSILVPITRAASSIDRALAASSSQNARDAARESSLRRAAWSGVMKKHVETQGSISPTGRTLPFDLDRLSS
jgi:ActR/RegA family two-component response regulator